MRRLGRVLGHHRQPGARRLRRSSRAARRLGRSFRNAGDLRGRTPPHPTRGEPRRGREARRAHPLVGAVHGAHGERDEQQSVSRQQGGRAHDDSGEVAGSGREGRHRAARRGLSLRRADDRAGLLLHGHARLRPGVGHGSGGGRRQRHLLHYRARLGLRLQAGAEPEARHQYAALPANDGRHGHRLRPDRRRPRHHRGNGRANFPSRPRDSIGKEDEERGASASATTSSRPGRSAQ